MMHPSFEQFVAALRDRSQRPAIGLVIADADAASLLTNRDWATDYFHKWLALFPAATAAAQAPPVAPAPAPAITSPAPAAAAGAGLASPATPTRSRVPLILVGVVSLAVGLAALAVYGLTTLTDSLPL